MACKIDIPIEIQDNIIDQIAIFSVVSIRKLFVKAGNLFCHRFKHCRVTRHSAMVNV